MRGSVLWLLSAAVLANANPHPARFDQRQTGTYNLHISLKDGQVLSLVKDVLVSAPVRNFGVTLKGPIPTQAPRTESPRTVSQIAKNAVSSTSTENPPATKVALPQAAAVGGGNSTNSRRQNNKVASQNTIKKTVTNLAPPPPHVQGVKEVPSAFPPLPPSIIAALTENRASVHSSHGPPAELNEIARTS